MPITLIDLGTAPNAGNGDSGRAGGQKINDSLTYLDTNKQAADATLTAFAALSWTSGVQVPVLTAADTFALRSLGVAASTDILTRADGDTRFAAASHNHAASAITSGTIAAARLGSGTADNTTFLRGDGTWAVPAGGGSYTDEQAQDAVGSILTNTSEIAWTYNDAGNTISASLINGSVALARIANIATARLLGRSTAGSGVIEELTVGSGLSLSGGVLSATGGSGIADSFWFGNGSDGAFSTDGTAAAPAWATKSGSVYTMTRDAFLTNLTLSGTAQIVTKGFRLFVNGTLDITAAAAGAINADGAAGSNGTGAGTGGTAGSAGTERTVGTTAGGQTGGAGATGAGVQATATTNLTSNALGGAGGASGAGGTGTGGAGAANRAGGTVTTHFQLDRPVAEPPYYASYVRGGACGGAGGGGGGNSTNSGGGGGGSSAGGAVLWIAAKTINRGAGTAAGAIRSLGGVGGNGGAPSGATNQGGGGAGGGGGGGFVYVLYSSLTGSSKSGALDASGGTGGNGGNATTGGGGGAGGTGGNGGQIVLVNLSTGAATVTDGRATAGSAPTAPSGVTGGTGGAGGACTAAL